MFNYPGGIPASMVPNSGEQWDFPNGWSPLNHMIIEGLRKSTNPEMQEMAFRLAQKWVLGNYRVYRATALMWEKYDVAGTAPAPGAGGEYRVQSGFGWTNGVILDLLSTYSDRLAWPAASANNASSGSGEKKDNDDGGGGGGGSPSHSGPTAGGAGGDKKHGAGNGGGWRRGAPSSTTTPLLIVCTLLSLLCRYFRCY